MKIALLSFEYPPETGFGGIGTYTWFHARALARLGHDVHVLAGSTTPCRLRHSEHDGVQVWRTRVDGIRERMVSSMGHLRWWWSRERARNAINMFSALRELQRTHAFDVVEAPECGAEGVLVNHFTRTPSVIRFHSPAELIMPYYDVVRGDIRCASALERIGIRGATAYTCCSQFLADAVHTDMKLPAPIDVIGNGIDVDWFDETEQVDAREALGLPRDQPLILFVGRMERRKGIHLCPDIVAQILAKYAVSMVFAGDDLFGHVANDVLPRLAGQSLRGTVHALGRLGPTTIRSLVRQADIVFLPSLWENCPYACLEAMAASRAIVASDAGGFPELLQSNSNGIVVPSEDVPGFVSALSTLIEDPALRDRLGAEARRTIERSFRDTTIAQRTVSVYERIRR